MLNQHLVVHQKWKQKNIRDIVLFKAAKYKYGKWMINFNALSPFVKDPGYLNNFPSNPSMAIGPEYFFNKNISLSILAKVGWGLDSYPRDTIQNLWYSPRRHELISQVNFAPKFYLSSHRTIMFYISPFIGFGRNTYADRELYEHYVISSSTGQKDQFDRVNSLVTKKESTFYEAGLVAGLLFNLTKNINFSAQFMFSSANNNQESGGVYSNYMEPTYVIVENLSPDSARRQFRGQIFLVYRLGGQVKEDE